MSDQCPKLIYWDVQPERKPLGKVDKIIKILLSPGELDEVDILDAKSHLTKVEATLNGILEYRKKQIAKINPTETTVETTKEMENKCQN